MAIGKTESCLFIGGNLDGLNYPVEAGQETAIVPVRFVDSETYIREELRVGDVMVPIYRHESLTAEQVIALLIKFYKAWSVNRPGGRPGEGPAEKRGRPTGERD